MFIIFKLINNARDKLAIYHFDYVPLPIRLSKLSYIFSTLFHHIFLIVFTVYTLEWLRTFDMKFFKTLPDS